MSILVIAEVKINFGRKINDQTTAQNVLGCQQLVVFD